MARMNCKTIITLLFTVSMKPNFQSAHALNTPKQPKKHLSFSSSFVPRSIKDPEQNDIEHGISISPTTCVTLSFCLSLTIGCSTLLSKAPPSYAGNDVLNIDIHSEKIIKTWRLDNGEVQFPDPMSFVLPNNQRLQLDHPALLGSGGGGAVFSFNSFDPVDEKSELVAVKVSWSRSTQSVRKECQILQLLEEKQTRNVEKCLGQTDYIFDQNRAMIVLKPVVQNDPVSSLSEIDEELQPHSVKSIINTMVDMLAANVVTVDVQPLISKSSGDVLLIDFTEAQVILSQESTRFPSSLDLALVSSFCGEMLTLIPPESSSLQEIASKTFLQELKVAESRGVYFSDEIYNIFADQSILMSSPDTLAYVESKINL